MLRDWYAHMARHGIGEAEADRHFAAWAAEDHYVPLPDELALLAAAGFPGRTASGATAGWPSTARSATDGSGEVEARDHGQVVRARPRRGARAGRR